MIVTRETLKKLKTERQAIKSMVDQTIEKYGLESKEAIQLCNTIDRYLGYIDDKGNTTFKDVLDLYHQIKLKKCLTE